MHQETQPTATAESRLLDALRRLERSPDGRLAIHIHLSRLQAEHRREHHLRVAAQTIENNLPQSEGQLYLLSNRDIVFIGRAHHADPMERAVQRLRYLFSEDPLIQFADDSRAQDFCSWYPLDTALDDFLAEMQRLCAVLVSGRGASAAESPATARPPLDPATLAQVSTSLADANLAGFVRNQSVFAVARDSLPVPVWDEIFISIDALQKSVAPRVDLRANRWLFLELSRSLDRGMLAYIKKEALHREEPLSVNLTLATLFTPEFMRFDEEVTGRLRGKLVVELQATDIFADIGSYLFARDYLRERGHRVCLDGMTHLTLPLFSDLRLGCDLYKLFWSPHLSNDAALSGLPAAVQRIGHSRVIMARCDTAEAFTVGRRLGIAMYQGFELDRMARRPLRPVAAA